MGVLGKPYAIMGIVNVTPDSFYDGGRYASFDAAVEHGLRLASEGADILDVGGVSTRPGAQAVSADEEIRRTLPVVRALAREFKGPVSIDTTLAAVAEAALDAGAAWVNDISAGRRDSAMAPLAARSGCTIALMHMRGTPDIMQTLTTYEDVVADVKNELLASVHVFMAAGVSRDRIVIDPGIGFAKTAEQNVLLLRHLDVFTATGFPVLIGTSRKSFIGQLTGRDPGGRLYGTLGSVGAGFRRGARIFRVHDVAATLDFLKVAAAVEESKEENAA